MSHTEVQWARGTTSQVAAYAGPQGELVLNTDDDSVHVQDGATASGFIVGGAVRNAQTGTSYAVVGGDQGKLITFDNAGAVAVALPQAGAANNFQDGARIHVLNLGAGTVTLTPATSTINGAAGLTLATGQGGVIVSDGTNYWAILASASGVTSSTLTAGAIPKASAGAAIENSLLIDTGTQLTYSLNSAPLPAGPAGTTVQIGGPNATSNRLVLDGFASGCSLSFRRADGTAAAPSAVQSGDLIANFTAFGYGSTGYSSTGRGGVNVNANQTWTDTAQGTSVTILTTATGADSTQIELTADSGILLGAAAGGEQGLGTLNAAGLYVNGVVQGPWVAAPAHDNSTGTAGELACDGSYLYVCTATNTWARAAIGGAW